VRPISRYSPEEYEENHKSTSVRTDDVNSEHANYDAWLELMVEKAILEFKRDNQHSAGATKKITYNFCPDSWAKACKSICKTAESVSPQMQTPRRT
jgi:hypothetical protein